jgi:hypothetical protein
MIEAGAVKPIVNTLQSEYGDVRNMAVYVLSRMAEYCMINYWCIIVELTDSTQQTLLLP